MSIRELNDEQLEQLDQTLTAWVFLCEEYEHDMYITLEAREAFSRTRKLQGALGELLREKQ